MEQDQNTSLFGLGIDQTSKMHLSEAARWARFLAIVGFVVCGLVVLLGIFAGSILSSMMERYGGNEFRESGTRGFTGVISFIYICMAVLYFIPCLFLFRFANHMKAALVTDQQETLNNSFQNLKAMFRFVGILTIIILSIYALVLLVGIAGAASGGL